MYTKTDIKALQNYFKTFKAVEERVWFNDKEVWFVQDQIAASGLIKGKIFKDLEKNKNLETFDIKEKENIYPMTDIKSIIKDKFSLEFIMEDGKKFSITMPMKVKILMAYDSFLRICTQRKCKSLHLNYDFKKVYYEPNVKGSIYIKDIKGMDYSCLEYTGATTLLTFESYEIKEDGSILVVFLKR